MNKFQKLIYVFSAVLVLTTLNVKAQNNRLMKPYLKTNISYLSVELTDMEIDTVDSAPLPGGGTLSIQSTATYDLDGGGVMVDIGTGVEVVDNLHISASLAYGYVLQYAVMEGKQEDMRGLTLDFQARSRQSCVLYLALMHTTSKHNIAFCACALDPLWLCSLLVCGLRRAPCVASIFRLTLNSV